MINIIYATYNIKHETDFIYYDDNPSRDWWLLLQTHSKAYFVINEQKYIMPQETAILYPPSVPLHYGAYDNEAFNNDWIRFYTDESFICDSKIPLGIPFEVSEFNFTHYLFRQLSSENFLNNNNKNDSIKLLFKLMFHKLEESLSFNSLYSQDRDLLAIRMELKNNPGLEWTIGLLAEKLHISTGYFHTLYRRTFGITCTEDLINMRIELAKDYLEHSHMSVYEVAANCGYNNVEHFSRQFKKNVGVSPSEYRKQSIK